MSIQDETQRNEALIRLAPPCPHHGRAAPKVIVRTATPGVRFVVCAAPGCGAVLLSVGRSSAA